MSDPIERQVVLKGISLCMRGQSDVIKAEAALVRYVEKIPSAEPERKKGHWINAECKDGTIAHKCSECKCLVGYSVSSLAWFNFCPWCGADMRGEK
jgi:hypothetical protein